MMHLRETTREAEGDDQVQTSAGRHAELPNQRTRMVTAFDECSFVS
jgi:hypothetical protein